MKTTVVVLLSLIVVLLAWGPMATWRTKTLNSNYKFDLSMCKHKETMAGLDLLSGSAERDEARACWEKLDRKYNLD